MQYQLTVRLPDDLGREISNYAKRLRLKRSDIVRMALERFFREGAVREEMGPYERVSALIGAVESGISDLGAGHRKYLVKRIRKELSGKSA